MAAPKHRQPDYSGKRRAPDSPGDTVTSRGEARSKPAKPRRAPSYRRDPIQILAPLSPASRRTVEFPRVTSAPPRPGPARATAGPMSEARRRAVDKERRRQQSEYRSHVIGGEAAEYARRAAIRGTTGKPSVAGRGASGAAAGGASGAAIGGAVGGPPGAAVGAAVGAVGGGTTSAVSGAKARREYRRSLARVDTAGPRRLIVAEFLVCTVVAALSPLTDPKAGQPEGERPGALMKRLTAIAGLFFILGLVSAAGRSSARAAAGFGGLVTVALLISQRSLFVKMADVLGGPNRPAPTSQGRPHPEFGSETPRPEGVGV
jgi:hypothetical protein